MMYLLWDVFHEPMMQIPFVMAKMLDWMITTSIANLRDRSESHARINYYPRTGLSK